MNFNHNEYFNRKKNIQEDIISPYGTSNLFSPESEDHATPINQKIKRGASAINRNRHLIAQSDMNYKNQRKSQRSLSRKLQPFIRASSSRSHYNNSKLKVDSDSKSQDSIKKSLIQNLKSANPMRFNGKKINFRNKRSGNLSNILEHRFHHNHITGFDDLSYNNTNNLLNYNNSNTDMNS